MLPPIEAPGVPPGESVDGRKEARVREIALSSMIQVSSMARIKAASTTRSSLSGRDLYPPGD